jgi:beta-phosphoglucomutase
MSDPHFSPSAFLVDLDGVLVHSHDAHVAAYQEAFRRHGLVLGEAAEVMVRRGTSRDLVLARAGVPKKLIRPVSDTKESVFLRLVSEGVLTPSAGAEAFLRQIKRGGRLIALVSASATARACLASIGLAWAFDTVVDGTTGTRAKPDPEPWLLAASRLGIPPSRCVAVEDSIVGAAGARRAGVFVVGVGSTLADYEVDASFPDLASIPVRRWLGLLSPASGPDS